MELAKRPGRRGEDRNLLADDAVYEQDLAAEAEPRWSRRRLADIDERAGDAVREVGDIEWVILRISRLSTATRETGQADIRVVKEGSVA